MSLGNGASSSSLKALQEVAAYTVMYVDIYYGDQAQTFAEFLEKTQSSSFMFSPLSVIKSRII